jgi:hypothetical protein
MEGGETGVRGWYKSMLKSMEVRFKTGQTERSLCSIERGGYWWKEEGGASNPHTAPLHVFDRVARGGLRHVAHSISTENLCSVVTRPDKQNIEKIHRRPTDNQSRCLVRVPPPSPPAPLAEIDGSQRGVDSEGARRDIHTNLTIV